MEVSSNRECAEALRAHKSFTFDSNFSILNLQNFGLKAEATTLLADALKSSNSLIDLNLGWNSIGSTGVEILSEVLPACSLEKLSLEVNGIEDLGVGYAAVALQHNRSITSLNLIGNEIGDTGAMSIAFLIKNNVYLKSLRMRYNKITALGGSYIADALKENENLEHLDLAWNSLCDKGGAAFVAALRVNSTLCRLDLSENKISQQIMDDINKLMQEPERKPKPPAPKSNGNSEEGGDSNGENDGEKEKEKRNLSNSAIGTPDTLPVNRELDLLMSTMRLEKERNSKEIARLLDENAELKKRSKEKEKDYSECKIALDHTLTENTELKKENRAYQHELSEYQEKTEAMRADVTQASRVLAFELENVRYQENKLSQELKELKTREDYLKDQFADHDSFLHKELSKIGEEKTYITSQLQELSHQRTAMEVALRAAEEDKELELLQLSKDIENLKAQSKGQGDYDLTRSFQDLKKSKQIEQEMEKQLQDAQQRTRGREQVLLKQLQIFKIHGYTAERRALIALLRNTRRLLKNDKTDGLQKQLKTLKEDLSLICNAVWLDLYNNDSNKGSMRAGIGESDNVIVVGTPTLKIKAENPKSAISMEIFNATKKHEIKRGSVIPLLYDGTIADSFPSSLSSGYPSKDFTDSANYVTQLVEMNPTAGVIATLYPLLSDYDTNGLGVEYNVVLESFRHELTITKKSLY